MSAHRDAWGADGAQRGTSTALWAPVGRAGAGVKRCGCWGRGWSGALRMGLGGGGGRPDHERRCCRR